jgi:hypothetical protein
MGMGLWGGMGLELELGLGLGRAWRSLFYWRFTVVCSLMIF